MWRDIGFLFLGLFLFLSVNNWAKQFESFLNVDDLIASPLKKSKSISFHGLVFSYDENTFSCSSPEGSSLRCQFCEGKNRLADFTLTFLRNPEAKKATKLMAIQRRKRWQKQYQLTEYFEKKLKLKDREVPIFTATALQNNNIGNPLLLRSFDVVEGDEAFISFDLECPKNSWPKIENNFEKLCGSIVFEKLKK